MRLRTICRALWLGITLTMTSLNAFAGITYQVVDLIDPAGQPNMQRIDYLVEHATPNLYGYTLYFDAAHFTELQTAFVGPDWFASIDQPDPVFSLSGLFNLLALNDIPSNTAFSVQFTWLGSGTPAAQTYDMFDDAFNVVGTGLTREASMPAPVPEPASAALILAGLAALARQRYCR